jgi:soluble lytic murein transglycosylase-like protein
MGLLPIDPLVLLNALIVGGLLGGVCLWNMLRSSNSELERVNMELRGEAGPAGGTNRQSGHEYLQPWLTPTLLTSLLILGVCIQLALVEPTPVSAITLIAENPARAAVLSPLAIDAAQTPTAEISIPDPVFPPQSVRAAGDCSQLSLHHAREIAQKSARIEGVSTELILAVIYRESSFLPCAVSSSGALGLMQLKPGTALDVGVSNPFDPVDNIGGGTRYLRFLLDRYEGDVATALRAYLNGLGTVERLGASGYVTGTEEYVNSVMNIAEALADD